MEANKRTKHQSLPPPQPYPWLLYLNGKGKGKGKKNQTFCSISDPTKTYSRTIPELGAAASLWTVRYGWCLFANKTQNTTKLFLWNPSNLNKIKLPPLKHIDISNIIFSCSPTATDQVCSIFLFSSRNSSVIFYCQLGEKQWTEVDYWEDVRSAAALEGKELNDAYLTNPVYCNGCLYAQTFGSFLVVIEKLQPCGLQINSARVSMPENMLTIFDFTLELLESNGELFQIEILYAQDKIMAVVVWRLNFSGMVWEKVESIKDRVFFISNYVCPDLPFACQAIHPETEGGRVYIALSKLNFVYIYNIEDKSITISQPFSNLPDNRSSSRWFMPDLRLTSSVKEEGGHTQIGSIAIDDFREFALPVEMVEKIAKHINGIDELLHFRATSSLFRAAAPLNLLKRLLSMETSPLFVYFEKDNVLTIAHPNHKYRFYVDLPKGFQANYDEICYSKDGWLLLAVNTISNIIIFNPFTREVKQLAYGPKANRTTRCVAFSHPPTSSECLVVQFDKIGQFAIMVAQSTKLGMEEWAEYEFEESNFPLNNMSPTYYKGEFYYISQKGKLGVLCVGEEYATWDMLEEPYAPCTGYYNSFLVECDGRLLSVFEGRFGKWVRVFKLDEAKMTWTRVESLGNHMLYVGNTSLSAVANIPGMENKIYFPRFYDQDIVFYSLETNKYHTFKNEVVNFHHVREQLNSGWIEQRQN